MFKGCRDVQGRWILWTRGDRQAQAHCGLSCTFRCIWLLGPTHCIMDVAVFAVIINGCAAASVVKVVLTTSVCPACPAAAPAPVLFSLMLRWLPESNIRVQMHILLLLMMLLRVLICQCDVCRFLAMPATCRLRCVQARWCGSVACSRRGLGCAMAWQATHTHCCGCGRPHRWVCTAWYGYNVLGCTSRGLLCVPTMCSVR